MPLITITRAYTYRGNYVIGTDVNPLHILTHLVFAITQGDR